MYNPIMFIADTNPTAPVSAVVTSLDGVTTVLAGFIFVCLVLPSMVRHRAQFYAAIVCVAGIILMHTLMRLFDLTTLGTVAIGVLQLTGFLLLVLCVGGLSPRELAGDMAKAYEVIRRGETEKEVIIPIGDQAVPGRSRGRTREEAPPRKVYNINSPNPNPVIDEDDETEDKGIPLS